MVKPGPMEKDLTALKKWIMDQVEEKGEVRWVDLWDKKRFKSERYLSTSLKELERDNVIEKMKIRHKDQRYRKAGSFDLMKNFITSEVQVEKIQPSVLEELRKMKAELANPMQRTAFISALILRELWDFLFGLERTVRSTRQLYTSWGWFFLQKFILRFGEKIAICGETCPEETERALQIVYWILYHRLEELSVRSPYILPPEPLPDLDLEQAKKDYERLLKALENISK